MSGNERIAGNSFIGSYRVCLHVSVVHALKPRVPGLNPAFALSLHTQAGANALHGGVSSSFKYVDESIRPLHPLLPASGFSVGGFGVTWCMDTPGAIV